MEVGFDLDSLSTTIGDTPANVPQLVGDKGQARQERRLLSIGSVGKEQDLSLLQTDLASADGDPMFRKREHIGALKAGRALQGCPLEGFEGAEGDVRALGIQPKRD